LQTMPARVEHCRLFFEVHHDAPFRPPPFPPAERHGARCGRAAPGRRARRPRAAARQRARGARDPSAAAPAQCAHAAARDGAFGAGAGGLRAQVGRARRLRRDVGAGPEARSARPVRRSRRPRLPGPNRQPPDQHGRARPRGEAPRRPRVEAARAQAAQLGAGRRLDHLAAAGRDGRGGAAGGGRRLPLAEVSRQRAAERGRPDGGDAEGRAPGFKIHYDFNGSRSASPAGSQSWPKARTPPSSCNCRAATSARLSWRTRPPSSRWRAWKRSR